MGDRPIEARVLTEVSDSAVVERVTRTPDGIGYVTLAWAMRGARALRLSTMAGLPYWAPDAEAVYRGQYPLTRFFNFYVRPSGRKLANGVITFVTSRDGQALVKEAGLVPTAVPVRFVRRSPMLGSH
jgi:ABC-type phosphate transport system substrate-binding protein